MIGIITQPLGYNYGGILQNFALQTALKKLGYDSVTIDDTYRYNYVRYIFSCTLTLLAKLIGKSRPFPLRPYKGRIIPSVTGQFIYNKINITKPSEGLNEKTISKYGLTTFIVGSDQVWRPSYNKSIYKMYLDCISDRYKKIAYAASFGTDKWEYNEEETLICKRLIESFAAVSTREKSGIGLVNRFLGYKDVSLVLDPTLLLEKTEYLALCRTVPVKQSHYLCAYVLDLSDEKTNLIRHIADSKNLELRLFSAHENLSLSVEEWLSNFRDASFVVTDSFHGTVFSIIFEKEFIVLQNDERGADRFVSLLSIFDLTSRIFNETMCIEDDIQWEKVNEKLLSIREKSMCYLKNNL